MRIRSIKPELLEDEKTAQLNHDAWRLFVSLLLLADDYGNLAAHEGRLNGLVFWGKPLSRDIRETLAELSDAGLVLSYEVRGQKYLSICNWSKHQKVDKPGKQRIPPPSDEFARVSRDSRENCRADLGPRTVGPQIIGPDFLPPADTRAREDDHPLTRLAAGWTAAGLGDVHWPENHLALWTEREREISKSGQSVEDVVASFVRNAYASRAFIRERKFSFKTVLRSRERFWALVDNDWEDRSTGPPKSKADQRIERLYEIALEAEEEEQARERERNQEVDPGGGRALPPPGAG